MKRWAVSYINGYFHELVTVIRYGDNWKEALAQHPSFFDNQDMMQMLRNWPDDLEEAKGCAFDGDGMIECIEIPNSLT